MTESNKSETNSKEKIILPLIVVGVIVVGVIGLYFLQKASSNNSYICTYLGRLWLPDKDKNDPDLFKCYTYGEYYAYED